MSTSAPPAVTGTIGTEPASPTGDAPPPSPRTADVPESLRPFLTELRALYRALPGLLAAGDTGRYVVLRGAETHGVWDTRRDASQYGHEKFDDGRFLSSKVDPKMLPVLTNLFGDPAPEEVG